MDEAVKDQGQMRLRLPEELKRAVELAAAASRRSINSEINQALSERYLGIPVEEQVSVGTKNPKRVAVTAWMDKERLAHLRTLTVIGPYKISLDSVIERGVELALEEIELLAKGPSK